MPATRRRCWLGHPHGHEALATLCHQVVEAEDAILGALDERERAGLRRLLTRAAGGSAEVDRCLDPCQVLDDANR
jgi:hypothetical protein